jgi:hypothetical protein
MKTKLPLLLLLSLISLPIRAQHQDDAGFNSITQAELRDHIFFLASDYMGGRVATSPQYDIAANYVASQFAGDGLLPVAGSDSARSYLQGVPFARTVYADELAWKVTAGGKEYKLLNDKDFKIIFGNRLDNAHLQLVWAGYGIEAPDQKWNDFKDLDLKGRIVVIMAGTPMKKGKPVLSKELNDQLSGGRGMEQKLMRGLLSKGAAGVVVVDITGTNGMPYDQIHSSFSREKTVFKGGRGEDMMGGFPSIYVARPEFVDLIMGDNPANPVGAEDNILKNYKPQVLDAYLDSKLDVVREENVDSYNVIGMVPGTDPVLKNEYIVVGGHLDHIAPQQGKVCNGADDNASGASGVMEIAEAVAMKPCKRTVVFATWTAEEMGLIGSNYFLGSNLIPKNKIKFNINLDMIGRTGKGNEESRAHWVVTDKKYVDAITGLINGVNDGVTDFPILFDNDEHSPGGSDHMTFIRAGIPAFFFFSGVHPDLHNPGDDPEKIDYPKAEAISRLGYLLAEKLGNMEVVPDFEE